MRATEVWALVDDLDHPEGVTYDPRTGALYTGGEDGQLYRVDIEGRRFDEVARAGAQILGLAVDGNGRVVACCSTDGVRVWDGEELHPLADDVTFANFPAFAPDGTLYFSDSGEWKRNDGRIVRLAADGTSELFSEATPHFTNGLAVTPDGRWLWVAESFEPNVSRFDLAPGGEPELVVRLDGTVPDGLAFTDDGGVLISCYRPDRIYHLDRDGRLEVVAEDPRGTLLAGATNVCFVGPTLDRIVSANLNRRHLTMIVAGLRGAPLHAPERWAFDALAVRR